jgi:hypothetical protein
MITILAHLIGKNGPPILQMDGIGPGKIQGQNNPQDGERDTRVHSGAF